MALSVLLIAVCALRVTSAVTTGTTLFPSGAFVTTLATSNTLLDRPSGLAACAAAPGSLFIAATSRSVITSMSMSGNYSLTLLAGGSGGGSGSADGTGTNARFFSPTGLAAGASSLYIGDTKNNLIRAVSVPGAGVTTLAGSGVAGFADGVGAAASFSWPSGVALSADGATLYVVDGGSSSTQLNNAIRAIVIATRTVTTVVGGSNAGGYTDGPAASARILSATTLAGPTSWGYKVGLAQQSGTLYFIDCNEVLRNFTASTSAVVSSIAGTRPASAALDPGDYAAGVGAAARFNAQGAATFAGVAPATAGALLAFDAYHAVRVVDIASATVSLLAGTPGSNGFTDGAATSAQFYSPAGAYFNAADGSIFVADTRNNAIRLIAAYALPVTASAAAGTTCASQPYAYGTISLGGYTGGNYAPFNTCGTFVDLSNSVTLTWPNTWYDSNSYTSSSVHSWCTWQLPATPTSLLIGQNNDAQSCGSGGSSFGNCYPAVRFTANLAYSSITYTASFCLTSACGPSVGARVYAGGSLVHTFPATGTPNQGCSSASPLTYTGSLASLPVGGVIELVVDNIATAGCGCVQVAADLTVASSSPTPSPSPSPTGTVSWSASASGSSTPSVSASSSASVSGSGSVSSSLSGSITWSSTASVTASPTASPSATPSPSWTPCPVSPATFPNALFPMGAVVGTLAASALWQPAALAGAAGFPGLLFAAAAANNSIFAIATSSIGAGTISSGGAVTLVAGGGAGSLADGVGTNALFQAPAGIASAAGALFVADFGNNLVRAIALPSGGAGAGTATTFAGKVVLGAGVAGYANGVGPNALFRGPTGIATDGVSLFVADSGNNIVRAISLASAGVSTLLGGGGLGNNNIGVALAGYTDGVGSNALFRMSQSITGGAQSLPRGAAALAVDALTNTLYILDANNVIRAATNRTFAATSTLVGTFPDPPGDVAPYRGTFPGGAGTASVQLNVNGNALAFPAAGSAPARPGTTGLALVGPGLLAVADGYNIVRIVDASGGVQLLAGGGSSCGTNAGFQDGTATAATFTNPGGVYYEAASGTLFVADSGNGAIRAIYPPSVSPSISGSTTPSTSVSPSVTASATPSASLTASASTTSSVSVSASASSSASASLSASTSGSVSPSLSGTVSWSASASGSSTPSVSASTSASVSGSGSVSSSLSGSVTWSSTASSSVTASPSISVSISASGSGSASATLSGSVTWSTTVSASVSPSPSASRSTTDSVTPSTSVSRSVTASGTISASVTATTSASVSATPSPVTGYVQVALMLNAPAAAGSRALLAAAGAGGGSGARELQFAPAASYSANDLFYALLALKCDLAAIGGVSAARVTVTSAAAAAAGLSAPALAMAQRNATLAGPALCAQLAALAPAVNASAPAAPGSAALAALTYQLAPSFLDGIAGSVTGDASYTLDLVAARIAAAGSNVSAYPLTNSVWSAINKVSAWRASFLAVAAPTTWGYAYGAVPQSGALTSSQQIGLGVGIGVTLGLIILAFFLASVWAAISQRRAGAAAAAAASKLYTVDPVAAAFGAAAAITPARG